MEKIDLEIDDFINYCDYKGLSKKTYSSYEQSLRRLVIYLKEKFSIRMLIYLYKFVEIITLILFFNTSLKFCDIIFIN